MRVCVQREQTLLVTTELVIWRCANAFIFTNQLEVDFGIGLVICNKGVRWMQAEIAFCAVGAINLCVMSDI